MTFLELMHVLFGLQEKFPGMSWQVEDSATVTVRLPVTMEHTVLLEQAREMFAPASA